MVYYLAMCLAIWISACDSPNGPSPPGPFDVSRIVVQEEHYLSSGGATVDIMFDRGVLVWDDPFSAGTLDGIFVELRIGSTSSSLAYVPIRAWLVSEAGVEAEEVSVALAQVGSSTAKQVSIHDPERTLLGKTIAVATPSADASSSSLVLHRFDITEADYFEVYQPEFSNAVRLTDDRVYWWGGPDIAPGGTYVDAWVETVESNADTVRTPLLDWMSAEGRAHPSNRYIVELALEVRYRDRLWALNGQTVVVAVVAD